MFNKIFVIVIVIVIVICTSKVEVELCFFSQSFKSFDGVEVHLMDLKYFGKIAVFLGIGDC